MTAKKPDAMANLQARADAAVAAAAARGQTNLFDSVQAPRPPAIEPTQNELATVAPKPAGKREKLLPVRHVERDFFLCDMFDYAMKDDGASMEAPIFSLSTRPDLTVWHWESKDGNRALTVTPSVLGRANMFDKDVLIYVISQMTEALNCERPDAKNRTVRFVVYDYLLATNKPTGGKEYQRLQTTLEKLRGTSIKTDIKTGGTRVKEGFGLIDSWSIVEKSPEDERMIAVEITLSKWLFNAVQAHEVLTIHRNYFRLRSPLAKRLYEIARKHCGNQTSWTVGLELLREKCNAYSHLRAFRRQIQDVEISDILPQYRLMYSRETDQVTFYIRDAKKLVAAIASGKANLPPKFG
jgi:plasmid replication initiation protein